MAETYPCPYTDEPCGYWKCDDCEIEKEEQEIMEQIDKEWQEANNG